MRAVVDSDACAGTGLCQGTCPEVFEVVDGLSRVKINPVPAEVENACRQAAADCPTGAIAIIE